MGGGDGVLAVTPDMHGVCAQSQAEQQKHGWYALRQL